ncbi:hypothetical protein AFLA70_17g005711 [Aspergillus flavus AF70]|nr:hypothetical protein AFLA70_17g005711 [Aspergillus flavus AF70]
MGTSTPYFELSWSISSTIGIFALIACLLVANLTRLSPLLAVPLVVSTACALANGLCYYAFYSNYALKNRVVAGVFADLFWLVQEAGLSFYSYQILVRALQNWSRMIYLLIFWILMAAIVGIRVAIMTSRAQGLLHGSDTLQYLVAHLHMGYFIAIALLEILSSGLLIKLFRDTHRSTLEFMSTSNILQQLIRTTEMRLATLALIGTGRSITYSFQTASQEVTSLAGQFDRFLYTMECLFPFIMLIDILASKIHRDCGLSDVQRTHDERITSDLTTRRCNCQKSSAEPSADSLRRAYSAESSPREMTARINEMG